MTITRKWQSGFELGDLTFEDITNVAGSANTNTFSKTGSRSLRIGQAAVANYCYVEKSATSQCRLAGHVRHSGVRSTNVPELLSLLSTSTNIVRLLWNGVGNEWQLYCGATQVATAASGTFSTIDTWNHIALDIKLHATAGWVKIWHDGTVLIDYSGKTDHGGSTANRLAFGNVTSNQWWNQYLYFDNVYWDDSAGEGAAALPLDLRFPYLTPNGDGNYSQFVGSDGNSVNNYLLVDEIPPNSDTDYVVGNASGNKDSYAVTTYTLQTGESIAALIPLAVVRKEDAASTLTFKTLTRVSATDVLGTAQVIGTGYRRLEERQTTKPGGGAWTQTALDGVEVGIALA